MRRASDIRAGAADESERRPDILAMIADPTVIMAEWVDLSTAGAVSWRPDLDRLMVGDRRPQFDPRIDTLRI